MTTVSQFAAPQGRRGFILHCGLRVTPLRWASQEPTKVVTVSQFAASRAGEASFWFASAAAALGLPGAPERGVSFAVRAPQGRGGHILVCRYGTTALGLP